MGWLRLPLVAIAGASSSEPVAAPDLGPTPEQAQRLADEQRERDFAGLNRSVAANCRQLGLAALPQTVAEIDSAFRRMSFVHHPDKMPQRGSCFCRSGED